MKNSKLDFLCGIVRRTVPVVACALSAVMAKGAVNLQPQIDDAEAGAVLDVPAGTYAPIVVTKPITLRGAAGATIDGGGTNRCATLCEGATLSGFTLRNGKADWGGGVAGGALADCVIDSCRASLGGGASSARLTGCQIVACSADESAAAALESVLTDCVLRENAHANNGSAAAVFGGLLQGGTCSGCVLTNNVVAFNVAVPFFGGLAYGTTLTNCTVVCNTIHADEQNYGLLFAASALQASTVRGNTYAWTHRQALFETTAAAITGEPGTKPDQDPDPEQEDPDPEHEDPDPEQEDPEPKATDGVVGTAYAKPLAELWGTPAGVVKSVKAVVLPTGLKLKKVSGAWVITGTPTETWNGSGQVAYVTVTYADRTKANLKLDLRVFAKDGTLPDPALAFALDTQGAESTASGALALWQGVAAKLAATVSVGAKVSTKGLPTGLKLTTSGGVGSLAGTPKKAGSFVAIFTVKSGKTSVRYTQAFEVSALPSWATGTFNGGGPDGQATLTLASKTAKAKGKWITASGTWTLSATGFAAAEGGTNFWLALTAKSGRTTVALDATVSGDGLGGFAESALFEARQSLWKSDWKVVAKRLAKAEPLVVEPTDAAARAVGSITLTFGANGVVKAKLGKSSCTAAVCPVTSPLAGAFDAMVYLVFPAKGGLAVPYVTSLALHWDGMSWSVPAE